METYNRLTDDINALLPHINPPELKEQLTKHLSEFDVFMKATVSAKEELAKKIYEGKQEAEQQLLASVAQLSVATAEAERLTKTDVKNATSFLNKLTTLTIGEKEEQEANNLFYTNKTLSKERLMNKITTADSKISRARREVERYSAVLPSLVLEKWALEKLVKSRIKKDKQTRNIKQRKLDLKRKHEEVKNSFILIKILS